MPLIIIFLSITCNAPQTNTQTCFKGILDFFKEEAKLKEHVAEAVHKYMLIPYSHPVNMIFFMQKNPDLLTNFKSVHEVIECEVEKNYKNVNEIVSLKLHFLAAVLKKANQWESGVEGKVLLLFIYCIFSLGL